MKRYMPGVYLRLLAYALPYRRRASWAFFCMVGAALFGVVPPWLMKNVVDDVLIGKRLGVLNVLAVGLVFLYAERPLFLWSALSHDLGGAAGYLDLRVRLYDHMQHMPLSFISGNRVGSCSPGLPTM